MSEEELLSQLERVKELNSDLKKELQNNLASCDVTLKTRNLTEEIFVKLRICLDKLIFYYLNKNNYPVDLSKVSFPISKTQNDFNSVITNYGLKNINQIHLQFFSLLLDSQPFSSKEKEILTILHEKGSKEKHQFLIKEKKETNHIRTTFKSQNGEISWSKQGVFFGEGVSMNGVPINPATQEPAFIPPTHKLIRHYEISIRLVDKNIEITFLCDSLIKLVKEIVTKTFELK